MKSVAIWMLCGYKRWISPAFPPSCRYVPTCSEYAMEAVERYGVWRGGAMAIWRLLRCHPLAKGGLDLVARPTLPQSTRKDGAAATPFQSYPETRPNQSSPNLEMTSY